MSIAATDTPPDETLCRYHMNGVCRDGNACRFSHDRSHRPSMTCRYYLQGKCAYGRLCRYDHVRATNSNVVSSSSSSSSNRPSSTDDQPSGSRSSADTSNASNTGTSDDSRSQSTSGSKLRADAPEFVPPCLPSLEGQFNNDSTVDFDGEKSQRLLPTDGDQSLNYAEAVSGFKMPQASANNMLCPYFIKGQCWYGDMCQYTHGEICEICFRPALHPVDETQRKKHREECMAEFEQDLEDTFAEARSAEKVCGICMETVIEKRGGKVAQRFGILQNCKHVFCLDCIRKWRQSKTFENKIVRACPECRTLSDFVTPSFFWVEDEAEKTRMVNSYRDSMKQKNCKYFKMGDAECPFGNQCFYRHAKPDGTIVEGDSPRTVRRRMQARQDRRRDRSDDMDRQILREFLLWQYIEERDNNHVPRRYRGDSGNSDPWLLELAMEDELDFLSMSSDTDSDDIDPRDLYWGYYH